MSECIPASAAPAQLWPVVMGEPVDATVMGATSAACFLRLPGGTLMALLCVDAVRLPFGILTGVSSAASPWRRLAAGDPARVGRGELALPGLRVRVSRWWRPPQVRPADAPAALRRGLAALESQLGPCADAPVIRAGGDPMQLLGRGPGLTPYGDDVLAGRILAAVAWGGDRGLPGVSVGATAAGATTAVSAACLVEAAAGRGVPEVVALVSAVGRSRVGRSGTGVPAALARLLRVGHTSGHGLAVGVRDGAVTALATQLALGKDCA